METKTSDDLQGQRQQRITKVNKLRELGIDPFPARSKRDVPNAIIIDKFDQYEGKTVDVVGRVVNIREHGSLMFIDIMDESGKLQLMLRKDDYSGAHSNGELSWETLDLLDSADFVQAHGEVIKTSRGEISIKVSSVKIIAKALRPLPTNLDDKELQFRRRYVDLALNRTNFELFKRKAAFWKATRDFLHAEGFIEVETPVLEHQTGGADARPFITHHNDLDQDFYLRISTELFQKRLIGGGFEKVFTLGPNFRNEGTSDEHLQEYYQVEWYWAYADYRDNMELVKRMFRELAQKVYGKTKFESRGHVFDLADEWVEIDYPTVIKERHGIDIFTSSEDEMIQKLAESGVKLDGAVNRNRLIDNLWKVIRKGIAGPAYLVNEPKFMSPLAKSKPDNAELTERMHLVIAGTELGNGYSEINDPIDQLERFVDQQRMRDGGDDEAQMMDIDFVEMLEYGMPPTSGWGHSERVFWFFENVTGREGTLFPQLKRELSNTTKKIYSDILDLIDTEKVMEQSSGDISGLPARDEALTMLLEHVKDEYQILHSKMVAKALESYASQFGENADLWYITGLLHDVDYYEFPDKHPGVSLEWFSKKGFPQDLIHAVEAHAYGYNGYQVEPKTKLAAALIACDEMSGLIYAYSLMRPEGITGMEVKSVKKKMKDKGFAAKISREDIAYGVEKLGVEMDAHIATLLNVFVDMPELKHK